MTRTLPRRDFLKACKKLSASQTIQPDVLIREWARIGYQRVNTVLEPGQFSHRGGLLDVWPSIESNPVRLDFFGDEIETIRQFDPATQRTVEKLESILITPAREFLAETLDEQIQLSEFHIPLLHSMPASLLDYLPQKSLILVDDLSLVEAMAKRWRSRRSSLGRRASRKARSRRIFPSRIFPGLNCTTAWTVFRRLSWGIPAK